MFVPKATNMNAGVWILKWSLFLLYMISRPDVTCQTESNLRIERGQLDSAPLMNHFGVTPSQEKERRDLIQTVMSLAVLIWTGRPLRTGRPLQCSNKRKNNHHSSVIKRQRKVKSPSAKPWHKNKINLYAVNCRTGNRWGFLTGATSPLLGGD